jgi:hypothetical protein
MCKVLIYNTIKIYPKSDFRPENFRNWIQREAFFDDGARKKSDVERLFFAEGPRRKVESGEEEQSP